MKPYQACVRQTEDNNALLTETVRIHFKQQCSVGSSSKTVAWSGLQGRMAHAVHVAQHRHAGWQTN
jgi:hypothetical protein